uniref:Uncharacterized protein n=1 Tax=Anolis carolinensis TaxID=28377 RepID=A0A803TM41_ANOCA
MAEAYSPVEPGLGPEESFLSLPDLLMSHERLPCRAQAALPRLALALGKAPSDALPEVSGLQLPAGRARRK